MRALEGTKDASACDTARRASPFDAVVVYNRALISRARASDPSARPRYQ